MKLSREPAVWGAAIIALMSALAVFDFPLLNGSHEAAWVAAVDAVVGLVVAFSVRPFRYAALTGLVSALAVLMGTYGLRFPEDKVAALNGVIVALALGFTALVQTPNTGRVDPLPPVDAR